MGFLGSGLLLIVYLTGFTIYPVTSSVPDYYWRDYKGLLPSDAIQGGKNEAKRPTYIGQFSVIYQSKIHTIPATIVGGIRYATGAHGTVVVKSDNYSNLKILCSSDTTLYHWSPISKPLPPDCEPVIGGYEANSALHIGRADQNKELVIGKVFANPGDHYSGLIIPSGEREAWHDNYDILVYCR